MMSHCHFVMTWADQISEWFQGAVFVCVFVCCTTSSAFPVQVGKPSVHPVNVSTMTSRYLYPWETGIWVKSICQSSPGYVTCHSMPWASWGIRAPWGLFNWQVGQEETTCLIVIWRPVPLKGLSINLWRAFSSKWVVGYKDLTNFHWKFPGRKSSPSFWNHRMWSSWKPSLLALRVSHSVYEGISDKLVCGTKVATPIRSLFCNAVLLAANRLLGSLVPLPYPLFGVLYNRRPKPQWADGLPPRA